MTGDLFSGPACGGVQGNLVPVLGPRDKDGVYEDSYPYTPNANQYDLDNMVGSK